MTSRLGTGKYVTFFTVYDIRLFQIPKLKRNHKIRIPGFRKFQSLRSHPRRCLSVEFKSKEKIPVCSRRWLLQYMKHLQYGCTICTGIRTDTKYWFVVYPLMPDLVIKCIKACRTCMDETRHGARAWRMETRDEGWRIKDEVWRIRDEGWEMRNVGWGMREEGWGIKYDAWDMRAEGWGMKDEGWGILNERWWLRDEI